MTSTLIMGSPARRLINPVTRCWDQPHYRYAGTGDGRGTDQHLTKTPYADERASDQRRDVRGYVADARSAITTQLRKVDALKVVSDLPSACGAHVDFHRDFLPGQCGGGVRGRLAGSTSRRRPCRGLQDFDLGRCMRLAEGAGLHGERPCAVESMLISTRLCRAVPVRVVRSTLVSGPMMAGSSRWR